MVGLTERTLPSGLLVDRRSGLFGSPPRWSLPMKVEVAVADVAAAVGQAQAVLLVPVEGREDVVLVLGQVADAVGEAGAVLVAVALVRRARRRVGVEADVLGLEDDVDHARDGVGAVDGRGAVLQHFDPLDGVERDLVQVDERPLAVVGEAVGGEPAAVQQHQRGAHAQAAHRHARGAGREAVGEAFGNRAVVVDRQHADDFGNRRQAGTVDFLARDHLDRRRGLGVDAADVRARHLDRNVGGLRVREQQCASNAEHAGECGRNLPLLECHDVNPQGR